VSFSSTTILEAIYNGIPTLILDFGGLAKYSNVFRGANLCDEERAIIMLSSVKDCVEKIARVLHDERFRARVLDLNRKMMAYFIDASPNSTGKHPCTDAPIVLGQTT
jgi:hypothetical protein